MTTTKLIYPVLCMPYTFYALRLPQPPTASKIWLLVKKLIPNRRCFVVAIHLGYGGFRDLLNCVTITKSRVLNVQPLQYRMLKPFDKSNPPSCNNAIQVMHYEYSKVKNRPDGCPSPAKEATKFAWSCLGRIQDVLRSLILSISPFSQKVHRQHTDKKYDAK